MASTRARAIEFLRRGRRRWWLAGGALLALTALAFPRTAAGGFALLALVAGVGAALALGLSRRPLELSRSTTDGIVVASVLALAIPLFYDPWRTGGLSVYDWAPHHANLKHLVDGMRRGAIPRWVQSVSTGESPYELYPLLPYWLLAKVAIVTHATDLTLVMVRSAIVLHVVAALGGALLARRLVAWPLAVLVGFVVLFDNGSAFGGGTDGLLGLGVVHAAMANAAWTFALGALLDALERPRLSASIRIWLLVAFASACHPLGLVCSLAACGALLLVALLARDIPWHRPLVGAFHVALGAALAACAWLPLGERLVLYGVHFGLGGKLAWDAFGQVLGASVPEATVGPLLFAGYLGVVAGILSRRAAPTLLACFVAFLAAGLFDQLYVLLNVAPSLESSRFQTVRLASTCKASLYVLGALVLELTLRRVRPWKPELGWSVAGALLAIGAAGLLRGAVPYFDRLGNKIRGLAHHEVPDPEGLRDLARWAARANAEMTPDRFGRLLHEDDRRFYSVYHVNALSGLPTLWIGSTACLFLRERIEDASAASLRRFNVRWVMHRDGPPSIGDATTERRFGRYYVRELPTWDGSFARVEQGEGRAVVTELEDERVTVELRDTAGPALVALGMGYYPRWQAEHAQRGKLPVYAWPSIQEGKTKVLAAWLPPGRTTFRPSAALPSDGRGTLPSALASLVALAAAGTWSNRSVRGRILRWMVRTRRVFSAEGKRVGVVALGVAVVALFVAGAWTSRANATALEVGNGLVGAVDVEARSPGKRWRHCPYSVLHGGYRCPGPLLIQDSVADLLEDAPPSWPFSVPAIVVASSTRAAEVRIQLDARLAGEYWAVTSGADVSFSADSSRSVLNATQQSLVFGATAGPRKVVLETRVAEGETLKIAFVRRDRLDPERGYASPPPTPPFR
jgi:hypothetical protein